MIKKTTIVDGLFYVEIPEANLYIQCGAPAESVKHLMKKKIIKPITQDGVTFETGPNAILLSDSMIQNGEFSNMSEFSVLQMLYRQGTILPNHPNNKGTKPILIGSNTQVNSQKAYIYRGNYGLISQKEIQECGVSSQKALELMNMKLKFAFGKLQAVDNLIESCIIENEKIEIQNGVFIQRDAHNIFTISYKDKTIEINLNLGKNQTYPSPYILPQSKIEKNNFSVIHTGEGDGWDINRASMNSIISFEGKLYIIDVVPNIKYILNALGIDINEIEGVFQTHTHDDHIAGITSLLRSDKRVKFFASKLVISAAAKKLSALLNFDELEFYNLVDTHELEIDQWNDISGLQVKPYLSPHPVETTIFVFRALSRNNTFKTYGHFADIIDLGLLEKMVVENDTQIGIQKKFYEEVVKNYTQKLDLKKIDIGGGMIHGSAKDFKDDTTTKLILAHTSKELSQEEQNIGVQTSFGSSDILILSCKNYDLDIIYSHLKSNFPILSKKQIEVFYDFNILVVEPETTIIKKDEDIQKVYLIISGQIEKVKQDKNTTIILTPGIIIGEKTALTKELPQTNYISKNYVKLLEIPVEFFYNFVEKNNLLKHMVEQHSKSLNLQKSYLLQDEITYATLNKIIEEIEEITVNSEIFDIDKKSLYIIIKGEVHAKINETTIEILHARDYFGGESAILSYPTAYSFEITTQTVLYKIPEFVLRDIPIVRWKILEKLEYQIQQLLKHLI